MMELPVASVGFSRWWLAMADHCTAHMFAHLHVRERDNGQ